MGVRAVGAVQRRVVRLVVKTRRSERESGGQPSSGRANRQPANPVYRQWAREGARHPVFCHICNWPHDPWTRFDHEALRLATCDDCWPDGTIERGH